MVVPSGDTYICYPCNIKSLSSPINASIYDLTGFKLFLTFDKEHIVVALYQIVHQCIDAGGMPMISAGLMPSSSTIRMAS